MSNLPDEAWVQPFECFPSVEVQSLYTRLSDRMREALTERGADIFDEMLAERAVFMYCHIRQKDRNARDGATETQRRGWDNDRARRETMMTWSTLVENTKRRWVKEDESNAADATKRKLVESLQDVLADLDPALSQQLREAMADAMATRGL